MYNRNYGGFDYVRIHSVIAKVSTKPKNSNLKPVTDGYTRPLRIMARKTNSGTEFKPNRNLNFGRIKSLRNRHAN